MARDKHLDRDDDFLDEVEQNDADGYRGDSSEERTAPGRRTRPKREASEKKAAERRPEARSNVHRH